MTVTVNGQTKTFKDGEGVTFPANAGRQADDHRHRRIRRLRPQPARSRVSTTTRARTSAARVVIYLGGRGPRGADGRRRTACSARARRNAIELQHAVAAIGPAGGGFGRGGARTRSGACGGTPGRRRAGDGAAPTSAATTAAADTTAAGRGAQPAAPAGGGRGGANPSLGDFQTVQRLDNKIPPQITASDEFFDFIFSAAGHRNTPTSRRRPTRGRRCRRLR